MDKYIGYFKEGKYRNVYGTPLACFKCGSNKCTGSKSFPLQFGGYGELLYCEKHEAAAELEIEKRSNEVTEINMKVSHS